MWRDIFFNNKNNISKAIDLFIKNLNEFKKDINSKNNKSIIKKLTIKTKKVRSKIIKLKQDINNLILEEINIYFNYFFYFKLCCFLDSINSLFDWHNYNFFSQVHMHE